MKATSEDVMTLLDAQSSLALAAGTDLFISAMPEEPDEAVCIYDSGGSNPEYDYSYDRPTFQIRVRGNAGDYRDAYALAAAIRDYLSPLADVTVGTTRYVGIFATGDIFFVGYDGRQRPILTMNFRAARTE